MTIKLMSVPDSILAVNPETLAHHYPMAAEVIRVGRLWLSRLTWDGRSRRVRRHANQTDAVARATALQVEDWE